MSDDSPDFEALSASFFASVTDAMRVGWAKQFTTTPAILRHLHIGYDPQRRCMTIPERDAQGNVIGIATREADGGKRCIAGSKRGLTYMHPMNPSDDAVILLVEGATDVMAGEALGQTVVGRPSAMGAFEEVLKLPAKPTYVVVGENDGGVGPTSALSLATKLAEHGRKVKLIFPPPQVKDLRAWAATVSNAGLDVQLAIENTKPIVAKSSSVGGAAAACNHVVLAGDTLDTIAERPIEWVWPNRFARGKLSLISGHPGVGKSTVMLDIAARITAGLPLPDGHVFEDDERRVLLISGEDDPADTIRPRIRIAGGDMSKIMVHRSVRDLRKAQAECLSLREHAAALSQFIGQTGPYALVIVDPISAYMGGTDTHNNADVRATLLPLAELAQDHRCAFVAVTHLNKGGDAKKAILRSMGSLAFVAAARSVFMVIDDPNDKARKLFLFGKSNIGKDPGGLAYRIEQGEGETAGKVVWETQVLDVNADEAMREALGEANSAAQEACDFLLEFLADGPRSAQDALNAAEAAGISRISLRRAKSELNVHSARAGGSDNPWMWTLARTDAR